MSERPLDTKGRPIAMGLWYWAKSRTGQVVGAGKFLATIGKGEMHFYINGTGYSEDAFAEYERADEPFQPPHPPASERPTEVRAAGERELREACERLFSLPNWENRLSGWKDIDAAVLAIHVALTARGAEGEVAELKRQREAISTYRDEYKAMPVIRSSSGSSRNVRSPAMPDKRKPVAVGKLWEMAYCSTCRCTHRFGYDDWHGNPLQMPGCRRRSRKPKRKD